MPTRTAREFNGVPPEVQSRLEGAGLRRTLATRAVLGLFLGRPRSRLTHAQAQGALAARGLDLHRVTLYRLLDRLAACGVLQREADEQRNWRFSLAHIEAGPDVADAVPVFECDACHRRFDLTLRSASASTRALARDLARAVAGSGHRANRLTVALQGTCADCLASNDASRGGV